MLAFVPVALVLLGGAAAYRQWAPKSKLHGVLTPERAHLFERAMQDERDPAKLRALGRAYDEQGLAGQGTLLRKRASLRELPPDTKAARRAAYKKGMASKNPGAIEDLARAFQDEGAVAAAKSLREYARGLRAAATLPAQAFPHEEVAAAPTEIVAEEPKAETPKAEKPVIEANGEAVS